MTTTLFREVYEWRWLLPGQQKHVVGRDTWQAHTALSMARKKYPELRERVFRANNTRTGVMITRVN